MNLLSTMNSCGAVTAVALVTLAVPGLSGCMVGPDYERPEADVNASWLESSPALRRSGDTDGTYLEPEPEAETGERSE